MAISELHEKVWGLRCAIKLALDGNERGMQYCRFIVSELGKDGPEPYVIAVCEAIARLLDEHTNEMAERN